MTKTTDPDPIQLLRRSNPVDADQLPSAKLARIRASVQEKVMSEIQVGESPKLPQRRRRLTMGLVGAAAIAGAMLLALGPRAGAPVGHPSDSGSGAGAGGGTAMCIAFELELLAQQEFALDGTVTAIDGESVSLDVSHWYRGSGDDHVSLTQVGQGGGAVLEGILVDFQVGGRYLVSGADGIITGCGYSQEWDASAAADWARAFDN